MAQADSKNSTTAPVDQTRRGFLAIAGGAGAAAVAITPAAALSQPQDDGRLLELEEQILEAHNAAKAHDDEIIRLQVIWSGELKRLNEEQEAGPLDAIRQEDIWTRITEMPESKEHTRLMRLGEPHYQRMDQLIEQLQQLPARTEEGRAAKVTVLLRCAMGHEWLRSDNETDYDVREARNLLIELVGGESAAQLRAQFADSAV
jgi:hypothetical protein